MCILTDRCHTYVRLEFQQFKLVSVIKRSLKVYPWDGIGLVRDSCLCTQFDKNSRMQSMIIGPVMDYMCLSYYAVFVAPEVIIHPPWRGIFGYPLFKQHLCLIAVDEAHCISEWFD